MKRLGGGSWNNKVDNFRSANRNRNNPDNRNNNGFRLAHYSRHCSELFDLRIQQV
jgi:formylglycine-generating enzyme required for sulfatase activity